MITCTFENGKSALLRHVTVNVIIRNEKGEVLVGRRASFLSNPGKLGLPGGYLDRDETTSQAAVRETLEETGYKIEVGTLFIANDDPLRPKEDRQNINFVYLAQAIKQVHDPNKETAELKWINLDTLPEPDEWAFDQFEVIELYKKYLIQPFNLPYIGLVSCENL